MKKTLLTFCLSLCALCGMSQTQTNYNEKLVVTINEVSTDSIPAAITVVDNGDGTCDFTLKNFHLIDGESDIPIGNIAVNGVKMEEKAFGKSLSTNQIIQIKEGDEEGISFWMGPSLEDVPVVLNGTIVGNKLYAVIDIDMTATLSQMIRVVVGKENETTAIKEVNAKKEQPTKVYSLEGKRIVNAKLPKGYYIIDGKKTIVK